MNNRFMKSYERMDGSFSTTVVDSLPTENIKPNTIYAVKKYDYYTSIYGTKMPTLTATNNSDWNDSSNKILKAKGLTTSQVDECTTILTGGAFAVEVYDEAGIVNKNIFENNMFSYELTEMIDGEKKGIIYTATSITELYKYLFSDEWAEKAAEFYGLELEEVQTIRDTLKSLNFKYQTTPLTADEIGVVFETTYEYYIYNGKEWINLDADDKPVITKSIKAGSSITTQLKALTFTVDEINLLKNGSELNIDYIINESTNESTICTAHAQNVCAMKFQDVTKIDNTILTYNLTFNSYIFTDTFRFTIMADITNKNNITVSVIQTQTVTEDNTSIPVSAWLEGGSGTYKYSAFINVGDVETQSRVIVMFGKNDAESGNFSPYVDTVDGGLTIYAKEKPTTDVSIHVEVFN